MAANFSSSFSETLNWSVVLFLQVLVPGSYENTRITVLYVSQSTTDTASVTTLLLMIAYMLVSFSVILYDWLDEVCSEKIVREKV